MNQTKEQDIKIRYILASGSLIQSGDCLEQELTQILYGIKEHTKFFNFFEMNFSIKGVQRAKNYSYINLGDTLLYFKIPPHIDCESGLEYIPSNSDEYFLISKKNKDVQISLPYDEDQIRIIYPLFKKNINFNSILIYCADYSPYKFFDKTIECTINSENKEYTVKFSPYPDGLGIESKIITKNTSPSDFLGLLESLEKYKINNLFTKKLEEYNEQ